MAIELPNELVSAVKDGRVVLFLGAGASRGAKDSIGRPIPDGAELAELLVTNYDLVIERAYEQSTSPVQRLVPNVKDGDGATDHLVNRGLLYVKLHGCITRYQEVSPPLVASTEQLIASREGRQGQFATFLEWAKTKTLVFCGYSFLDSNLRILFDEIIKEGDNRPRHYIISKGLRPAEIDYWRDRRVVAINGTFQEFVEALDTTISKNERMLGALAASPSKTTFTRFITKAGLSESQELKLYFTSYIEHIGADLDANSDDPSKFYKGFDLGWWPIIANLDVRQPIVDEIINDHVLSPLNRNRPTLIVLKGHAGSGKTTVLRRVCYESATIHGRLCFFVARNNLIQKERFEEIFRLTDVPIYLFVDDIAEHRHQIAELIGLARDLKIELKIIATEAFNTWNVACDELETSLNDSPEMHYLSAANIAELVNKLEKHDCLGYLKSLSPPERIHELEYVHGRQLLVALLEATHGIPLMDIISDEYRSISPDEAKLLYLDICSLHRFGPPVRAGLISRIHNISFEEFRSKLFRPLEAIVVLREDRRSGDFVYEARHPYIAHAVYETILTSEAERFDNIIRIMNKLNPDFIRLGSVIKNSEGRITTKNAIRPREDLPSL